MGSWATRGRIGLLILVCAVVTCGAVLVSCFAEITMALLTPNGPFDPERVPPAPRYDDPESWSALPTLVDAADAVVATLSTADQTTAPVDVFYVHPTSYVGSEWNARMDDETVNKATDMGATRIQASAFNGCCAIYAPRYRQANLTAFTTSTVDGMQAIGLGGMDVVAAFRHYVVCVR